ncbi:non-ribosomal peptide synthetase [Acrocarpospora catenulata]|uniref:non-ribosomal peptide synthetase n=1 Tax=Acrocarpospora catenulata TaxID=2836182 RepID=UPI001BD9F79D|nr:non-ribosomal peptide synthetase [Acrocarpospora catenulata]
MSQPLSYGQERLWFLHRLDPLDHSYNTCHADRLRGPLDLDRLAAAFTAVATRQESLRTCFTEVDGTPVAVVRPPAPVPIAVVEAADLEAARQIVSTAANTPFDLATPPLRVTLVRLSPEDHILAITVHHIIADGMSAALLVTELAACYAGEQLPPLPLQYGDHARAERAKGAPDVGPWAAALAGTPVLELPLDRPRPPQRTGRGGEVTFTLDPGLAAAVAELARRQRCTPFMVWLTAYQVLLARHSGQDDFCVGSPVARRDRTELEPLIGHLAGTLLLRTDLGGNPSFLEALRRTRRTVIEAIGQADLPLELLLGALDIERDLSRTPLFQTMFALHTQIGENASAGPVPGTEATPFAPGWLAARTDLSLDLWPAAGGALLGSLIYSADLFDQATADRLAARFAVLVESVVADPETRVGDLDLLPEEERSWLLSRERPAEVPPVTLADLFLAQAATTPDALAVDDWTYADLLGRAQALAARLRDKGVGRGSLVAVQVSRGPGMLAAFLGVTLSGAAYLPVDPEYPQARVDYVLADSGAALTLTDADLEDPSGVGTLDALPEPGDVAYVLYTSGSTGRPKGVVVPHGALTNLLLAMKELFEAGPEHAWLALTSTAFDISAVELFLPLITGGRVVVASADHARDGVAAAELIRATGATHVQATPSGWRILLTGDLPEVCAVTAGEPLSPKLARELRARTNRLVNGYGPTETTIYSTAWDVPADPAEITIGHPVANTVIHILDRAGNLAPIGVPGELVIGGLGVTNGYLGRPELTAERFVPDADGNRRYRTGDLARWRPDGTIEFLGRTDNQIKLRGHRIELGEIEAVLEQFPGVRQAVAAVRDDTLVAFVVLAEGSPEDVRAHVARFLPGYMVPRQVVALDALPMTPNGKIDRKALPTAASAAPAAARVAPRTATERLVAGVFADVLGRTAGEIGVFDDFFALGGHSLLATMVAARLPVRVPVREVFTRPTAAALAELLDGPAVPGLAGPRPREAGTVPPLSAGQERLWFLNRLYPETDAAFNMWVVRRLRGPLDADRLRAAFAGVAARHESLRTRFPEVDGGPVVVIDLPGPVPVEYLEHADPEAAVAERVNTPFQLADRPPLRVTLIRQADGEHVLCLVMHHILGDGWSLNVLLDELADLYSGRALPPVPLQFGDVAAWQRARDTDGLLAYWRERLAEPTPLDLPTDRPRTAGSAGRGATVTFTLDPATAEALAAAGRRNGATLFMTLLAAYQVLLARHSGQDDILVGTSNAGRDTLALESVIGYLTDILVLRGDLGGDPLFSDLLRATRTTVLDAFAHQGIPFEDLVKTLQLERDLTRTPVFQTMAILHTEDSGHEPKPFDGLAVAGFPGGHSQAKFDVMLEAWHDDGAELLVQLEYDTALFDAATVAAMADRFALLLRAVAADPDRRLSALPMLTEQDSAFLAKVSEGPALDATPPRFMDLWASSVLKFPDSVAVSCGDRQVTYRELAAMVDPSGPAGIREVSLERSPEGVAALLSAWASGAAYLPIDETLPPERAGFMRSEAAGFTGEDAAYVIYTSGSTGTPKGVVVGQDALAARIAWMTSAYGLRPSDRIVQFAALSFDTHAEEIFPALAAGATLELLPDGAVTLPDVLAVRPEITVLDLPTAYWHHLVGQLDDIAWPPGLRLVILGGEEARPAALARWHARFGDRVRVVNTYGPTEATVIATATDLTPGDPEARLPIGRPVAGTLVRVLDQAGCPVPPGAPGELCIGGAGLARGYLRRPELTAERFVSDPWGTRGARLYRTGDRARWRRDGQLEFLGRTDDQLKIRGYRVEPGEVESRLLAHHRVRQAAVTALDDRLVGYVVGDAGGDELAEFLRGGLPAYMVPSVWVELAELPLTRHGKVDRRALPYPEMGGQGERVAPRTDAEQLVAEVYGEVLGLTEVGALDDFFAIGGHSLLAARVIARLRAITGVEVPIRTMFDGPEVAALAEAVENLLVAELTELSDEEAARLVHGRAEE